MAVQVLAGPVIPHRGARVGVTGGDLHVAQVSASVEHGRDICVTEHMRMCPGDLDAGGFGEQAQAPGGRVPVHPGAAAVEQDRPADPGGYCPVDGPADRSLRQRRLTPCPLRLRRMPGLSPLPGRTRLHVFQ